MTLESFYGGKQGLSSVIKKAFKYISTEDPDYIRLPSGSSSVKGTREYAIANNQVMEYCFRDNDYQEVWYGELCLIDTINKNNPANGCLFRRTLARQGSDYPTELYTEDEFNQYWSEDLPSKLSAEYIGKLAGPRGGNPFFAIESLDEIDNRAQGDTEPIDYYYDKTVWSKDINKNVYDELLPQDKVVYRRSGLGNNVFISGKDYTLDENNITDDIIYNWFNISKGSKDESWVYLGFQIPYPEFDFEFNHINYFQHPQDYNTYDGRLFYQDWHIYIPKGVRGNSTTEIGIITLQEATQRNINIYQSFSSLLSNIEDGNYSFDVNGARVTDAFLKDKVTGIDDSVTNMQTVPFYYCKYTVYNATDTDEKGHSEYFYLGLPKDIDNFTLSADGYITAHYKDNSSQKLNQRINWVTSIMMMPANASQDAGVVTITYNDNHIDTYQLSLINNIIYDDTTGKFSYTNTGSADAHLMDGQIIHPKEIEYDDSTGTFLVTNNTGPSYRTNTQHPIKYVNKIEYDDHEGQFVVTYNAGTEREAINTSEDLVSYYKNITFDKNTGLFTGTTNLGEQEILNPDGEIIYPKTLNYTESTGVLSQTNNLNQTTTLGTLSYVSEITYDDETGLLTASTNIEDNPDIILNEDTPITYLKTINLRGDAAADGSDYNISRDIQYTTNINNILSSLGDEINYIQDLVKGPDGHLYVLFNAPSHRYDGTQTGFPSSVTDDKGYRWRNDVAEGYSNKLYWRDCGLAIGYHEGLYVGKVIPLTYDSTTGDYKYDNDPSIRVSTYQDVISRILNVEYPNGFTNIVEGADTIDRQGMLAVTRLKSETDPGLWDTYYFAYNYDNSDGLNRKWYLIQKGQIADLTIAFRAGDTEGIDVSDVYFNMTEYTRTVTGLRAPWLQGGVYALPTI